MPLLPSLARALSRGVDTFPMNGLVVLERTEQGTYVERWRDAPSAF
jgi:hypothetical protein